MVKKKSSRKRSVQRKRAEQPAAPIELSQADIRVLAAGGAKADALSRKLSGPRAKKSRAGKKATEKASPVPISAREMKAVKGKSGVPSAVQKRIDATRSPAENG